MVVFDQSFYDYLGPVGLKDIMEAVPDIHVFYEGTSYKSFLEMPDALKGMSFNMLRALDQAGDQDLTFLTNKKYLHSLNDTKAPAVVTFVDAQKYVPSSVVALLTPAPHRATARILSLLGRLKDDGFYGMSSSVASTAIIGEGCKIAPTALIGDNAHIGDGTVVAPGAVIGCGVKIGRFCEIGPSVHIMCSYLGDRVTIRSGARIGERGFGFSTDGGAFEDIPHFGCVEIESGVEIGCNTTIDRGSVGNTIIGEGSKIDNQVMIGHNVQMGKQCILAAQVGISGSTILGNGVVCGGQVGIAGHLKIEDGVVIGAKSGIMHNLEKGKSYMGYPADEKRIFMKKQILIKRLLDQ